MKYSFIPPLLSGLVLPGLGQVVNQQIVKGLILISLTTFVFLFLLFKLLFDLSAVMREVMGPDLTLGPGEISKVILAMRARDMTLLYVFLIVGVVIWAYSVTDAFLVSRRLKSTENQEG